MRTSVEPLLCGKCGALQTQNPHSKAGDPSGEFGFEWHCIPCLVKSRAGWANRCYEAERERDALIEAGQPSAPETAALVALTDGIELAAKWVEQRLADYDSEHGNTDHETGTREYPGRGAGEEYVSELNEIIEGIRALAASQRKKP